MTDLKIHSRFTGQKLWVKLTTSIFQKSQIQCEVETFISDISLTGEFGL